MIHRRRILQMAALAPVASTLPAMWGAAAANASTGTPIGAGAVLQADEIIGVSLSWIGEPDATAAVVRALIGDVWGDDIEVRADHGHGPEDPTGRLHGPPVLVPGADAYWIGTRDGSDVQVHELATRPHRLALLAADLRVVEPIPGLQILERSNWTDIARRDTVDCVLGSSVFGLGCRSDVGLRHAIVHHTVNINDYSEADVPDLLFAIQRYHVDTRGWDDIGYNFVIDRFGRIWQARDGDLLEPIVSGHTTGLNAESVGVAVLGNFSIGAVPDTVVDSLGSLLGWKLGLHGVDPLGHTLVRSSGGDYAEHGELVDLRNISGHRDNQQTSCPGTDLYNRLDEVRTNAAELVPVFGHLTPTYSLDEIGIVGWVMDRFSPTTAGVIEITVDDGEPTLVPSDLPVYGLDVDYPGAGANHGFDHTVAIDVDTTSILVRATSGDGHTAELMNLKLFATFLDVEPDRFFAPGVYFLREKGLTTGSLPGLFEPMDHISRAQMATFLHRFMDLPTAEKKAPFKDLEEDSFYIEAVHWLHGAGITTGTSPTEFSPYVFVTRAQMATFLWRLCGEIAPAAPTVFEDIPADSYFTEAVAWLAETEITIGVSATAFAPDREITRGEMATFLERLARSPEAWAKVDPPSSVALPPIEDPPGIEPPAQEPVM